MDYSKFKRYGAAAAASAFAIHAIHSREPHLEVHPAGHRIMMAKATAPSTATAPVSAWLRHGHLDWST